MTFNFTPPGPEAAIRRARKLRRRQRASLAAITAMLVTATGLGIWLVLPTQEQSPAAVQQATTLPGEQKTEQETTALTEPAAPRLDLSWRVVDGTVGYADEVLTSTDGTTYALSTAPGVRHEDADENFRYPMAVYNTTDGETWESTLLGDDRVLRDLAERDGLLYAIATAPGESTDGVSAEVVVSSDGGSTWDPQPLSVEVTPPDGDVPIWGSTGTDLAATDDLIAALVTASFSVDASALLEERFDVPYDYFWDETDDGLTLTDMSECFEPEPDPSGASGEGAVVEETNLAECGTPAGEVTWSELGVTDPASRSQRHFFILGADGSWDEVDLDLPADVQGPLDLYGTSSGLLLSAYGEEDSTVLFRSVDGVTWDDVATVGFSLEWSISGDRVILAQGDSVLVSTDGGATFDEVDVSSFIDDDENEAWVTNVAAGPLGFAAVLESAPPLDDSYTPELPEDPESWEEFEPERPDSYVVASTDGASWSSTDLAEVGIAGDYVNQVMVGANHVGVVVAPHEKDANGDLRHDVLLGTPER